MRSCQKLTSSGDFTLHDWNMKYHGECPTCKAYNPFRKWLPLKRTKKEIEATKVNEPLKVEWNEAYFLKINLGNDRNEIEQYKKSCADAKHYADVSVEFEGRKKDMTLAEFEKAIYGD